MFSIVIYCYTIYIYSYTVNAYDYLYIAEVLKPKLLTINTLYAFTSSFTLGKWCATSIYTRAIRPLWMYIRVVFAVIFRERYNLLQKSRKCLVWPVNARSGQMCGTSIL